MSINFNDADLRTSSDVIIETPQELAQTIANKGFAILGKADALVKDQANELFYNNVVEIIKAYHDEIAAINGSDRKEYSDADLQAGGALASGNPHFPESPIWVKFPPKVIDSMNGNPATPLSDHEIFRLGELNEALTLMKTGFIDGATSTTLDAPYSGGTTFKTVGGSFALGNRVVISGGGSSALVEVTLVTVVPPTAPVPPAPPVPGYTEITVTVLAAPSGSIPIGGSVKNFFSGFSNTNREMGTVSPYLEVYDYFKTLITQEKDAEKAFLNTQLTALGTNTAVGPEAADIATAISDVQSSISSISTWEALAETGVGAKYGDTGISNLEDVVTDRSTQAPDRATAIANFLGSAVQAADASVSGSGQYFTLSNWVNLRINKSAGSLRVFYDFDQIIGFIDATIAVITAKKAEYDAYMLVKRITSNPNNTAVIGVSDVTGLSPMDSIKIIDKVQPSMVGTIQSIVGNIVTLDVPVPDTYTVANTARLIKLL